MLLNVILEDGAKMPTKAHEADAGYDLYTPIDFTIRPNSSEVIDTLVRMEIPLGYVGMLKSKSGLMVSCDCLCEGVVDSGYTGTIRAKIFNHSNEQKVFRAGQKITQICIMPVVNAELVQVKEFKATDRGEGGFGSTGE